jgi:hypothetical protein
MNSDLLEQISLIVENIRTPPATDIASIWYMSLEDWSVAKIADMLKEFIKFNPDYQSREHKHHRLFARISAGKRLPQRLFCRPNTSFFVHGPEV